MSKCLWNHQVNLLPVHRDSNERRGLVLEFLLSTGGKVVRFLGLKAFLKVLMLGASSPVSLSFHWVLPGLEVMTAAGLQRPCAEKPLHVLCPWRVTCEKWPVPCLSFSHPTSCSSAAEIMSVLLFHVMKYKEEDPENPNNDRFILCKVSMGAQGLLRCSLKLTFKATMWQQGLKWALFIFLVFLSLPYVIVHLDCYNEIPKTGWLIDNRNLSFIVLGAGSQRSSHHHGHILVRGPVPGHRLLIVSSHEGLFL